MHPPAIALNAWPGWLARPAPTCLGRIKSITRCRGREDSMAGGPIIDVTNFIDERRFSWFQGRVLALCILLQICDGIDLQAIGYTGARIRAELHPTLGEMGWVFSAGLIGMACGALIFGPVADKIGRRAVMIISVFLFGAFSFAIAFVDNIWELMALRFCAGLGFGGALPNSLGLVAEYVPKRSRY